MRWDMPFRPVFCKQDEHLYQLIEFNQLRFRKVVFGDRDIPNADNISLERGQSHVLFIGTCTRHNQFRCCASRRGIQHLVLYGGKKIMHLILMFPKSIVFTGLSNEVTYLLVKTLLRCPNIPDTGKQLFIMAVIRLRVLQPFVVQRKPFDHIFLETFCSPRAEHGASRRVHPVSHMNNSIEIVKFYSITPSARYNC